MLSNFPLLLLKKAVISLLILVSVVCCVSWQLADTCRWDHKVQDYLKRHSEHTLYFTYDRKGKKLWLGLKLLVTSRLSGQKPWLRLSTGILQSQPFPVYESELHCIHVLHILRNYFSVDNYRYTVHAWLRYHLMQHIIWALNLVELQYNRLSALPSFASLLGPSSVYTAAIRSSVCL